LTLTNRSVTNNNGTMSGTSNGSGGTVRVTINLVHDGQTWRVHNLDVKGDSTPPK
jgi:hypothetical protein